MKPSIRLTALLTVTVVILGGCERPPMDSEQSGYRGTGMNQINNPRLAASPHTIPAAPAPVPQDGPRAGEIFQNVQVLGDLSVAEFTRTMTAITEWVSPAEGCNYCHMPTDLASDDIYTKVVSRRMLEMTRNIDKNWGDHVGGTGVTCYTCHQGNAVPVNIWFEDNSDENASRFAGNLAGQNMPHPAVGLTSLPSDPFSSLLISSQGQNSIRVLGTEGHATGQGGASIQSTEATYGLMMHLSESLGVNCTFCHQTAHFGDWSGSTNARVVAFHGIKMVQELNEQYLAPLASALPEHRLGPAGDAPKANCQTCHSGLTKPLGGAQMAADFPAFRRDK